MTGSLRHLGDDRWQVRYYAGLNPATGRQRERTRTFRAPNGRAAKKEADTIRAAIRRELDGAQERKGTVGQLVDEWLVDRRRVVSPTTWPNYQRIARAIDARFGRLPLADLNARLLDRWYGELLDGGMSPASIGKYHSVLRAMLRQGARWDMVDKVATFNARPPRTQRFKASPPTVHAAEVIIATATGDLATALRFIQLTGLRRGELCGLAWPDVTGGGVVASSVPSGVPKLMKEPLGSADVASQLGLHSARLTVRRTVYDRRGGGVGVKDVPKGGEPRDIALSPLAVAVLADQWAHLEHTTAKLGTVPNRLGPIWADLRADPAGRVPRRPGWLSLRWRQLCANEGATGIRLHDLRHMHATMLIDAGVPITSVSKRLGHSRTSTTLDLYAHATAGGEEAAIAAIEVAFGT